MGEDTQGSRGGSMSITETTVRRVNAYRRQYGCNPDFIPLGNEEYDKLVEELTGVNCAECESEAEGVVFYGIPVQRIEEMEREMETERIDDEYKEILRAVKGWWE